MSMIGQLRALWADEDRVKQLAACNAGLAERLEEAKATAAERKTRLIEAENERDATAKQLEETTRDLTAVRAERDKMEHSAAWLQHHLDNALADLNAAEQLLDEAGERIDELNAALDTIIDEHGHALDKLDGIAEVIQR